MPTLVYIILIFILVGPNKLNILKQKKVSAAILVDSILNGFPNPSLSKCLGKLDYSGIKETHQLLTEIVMLIDISLEGGYNGYLRLVLPPNQYARISNTPFVQPPNPGCTSIIPSCATP